MASARTKEDRSENQATEKVGGERVDANGKRWHLRSLRTNGDTRTVRPHCEWCGLFIDVFGYFESAHGELRHDALYIQSDEQLALHEDCLERRDAHIAYMRGEQQQRYDRAGDSQRKLPFDKVAVARPGGQVADGVDDTGPS